MARVENPFNENIIEENIDGISYFPPCELLVDIYINDNNYLSLIKMLNRAIKCSDNQDAYRKLRKAIIYNKIIQEMSLIGNYR